jgi:hypothetical protein
LQARLTEVTEEVDAAREIKGQEHQEAEPRPAKSELARELEPFIEALFVEGTKNATTAFDEGLDHGRQLGLDLRPGVELTGLRIGPAQGCGQPASVHVYASLPETILALCPPASSSGGGGGWWMVQH